MIAEGLVRLGRGHGGSKGTHPLGGGPTGALLVVRGWSPSCPKLSLLGFLKTGFETRPFCFSVLCIFFATANDLLDIFLDGSFLDVFFCHS